MSWYRKLTAGRADAYLRRLNVPETVIQAISAFEAAHPEVKVQPVINQLRANPNAPIMEVQKSLETLLTPSEPVDEFGEFEASIVDFIANEFGPPVLNWATRQARSKFKAYRAEKTMNPGVDPQDFLAHMDMQQFLRQLPEISDWVNGANPQLNNMTVEDAAIRAQAWHEQLGREEKVGKVEVTSYDPTDPANIVYGPQWKNQKWNGWTVQKLTTNNDFVFEGIKMNHCVGDSGYFDKYRRGNCIIFSLRDPSNNPHVTIETDSSFSFVKQVQAAGNNTPKPELQAMIKEWFTSTPGQKYSHEEGDLDYRRIARMPARFINEYLKENLEDDYGLVRSSNVAITDLYESVLASLHEYRNGSYYKQKNLVQTLAGLSLKDSKPPWDKNGSDLEKLTEAIQKNEEEADMQLSNIVYDEIGPMPAEESTEFQEWLKKEQELMDGYRQELPWGFNADLLKAIEEEKASREKARVNPQ